MPGFQTSSTEFLMRKSLLSAVLVAAGMGLAGVASAQTYDSPMQAGEASTMTQGEPNAATTNSPYSDGSHTLILGAGPSTITTYETVTTYSMPDGYVVPSPVVTYGWGTSHGGATASSSVPDRAGEASTMTHGVPNVMP
jgi:hypothetical protein